jgi:hypothetical protein
VNATKRLTIEEAPPVLVLSLKRFHHGARKAENVIEYPSCLSLHAIMSPGHFAASYKLYGQILHYGAHTTSGHYVAHAKGDDGQWRRMDDENVQPLPFYPFNDQNAYILFYTRVPQQITAQESLHTAPNPSATPEETTISVNFTLAPKEKAKNDMQPVEKAPVQKWKQIDIGCGRTLVHDGAEARFYRGTRSINQHPVEYTPKPRSLTGDKVHNPFLGRHISPVRLPKSITSDGAPYKSQIVLAENGPVRSSVTRLAALPLATSDSSPKNGRRFIIGPNGPYTRARLRNTLHESRPSARR